MSELELRLLDSYPLRYLLRPRISTEGDESPPLLCFLHGYDEGAPLDIFDALTRHGPFAFAESVDIQGSFCHHRAAIAGEGRYLE